jgi:hypothetical protein
MQNQGGRKCFLKGCLTLSKDKNYLDTRLKNFK